MHNRVKSLRTRRCLCCWPRESQQSPRYAHPYASNVYNYINTYRDHEATGGQNVPRKSHITSRMIQRWHYSIYVNNVASKNTSHKYRNVARSDVDYTVCQTTHTNMPNRTRGIYWRLRTTTRTISSSLTYSARSFAPPLHIEVMQMTCGLLRRKCYSPPAPSTCMALFMVALNQPCRICTIFITKRGEHK